MSNKLSLNDVAVRKQLTIFSLVYLCYLLAFFCRLMINPLMPSIGKDLQLDHTQIGGFFSAFYFGYIFTNLPGGLLTNYYGYRKVILGTLCAIGIATISFGFVTSYHMGFMVRVLDGIGSGATFAACMRAIFEWFPNSRGLAIGILQTGTTGGLLLANLISPIFAEHFGWHATFHTIGAIPLITMVVVYFFLSERPKGSVHASPKIDINAALFWKDILSMFKNRNLVFLSISGFFAMAATWGTAAWANTYLKNDLHISLVDAGIWMSIYSLSSVLTKPFSGFFTDRVLPKNRKYLVAILLFLLAPALLWFSINKDTSMLYVLMPLLGIVAFAYSPVMNTFIGDLVPVEKTGAAAGFLNSIWQTGSLTAPIIIGLILDHSESIKTSAIRIFALDPSLHILNNSYFYAFSSLALAAVFSGIAMLFIQVEEKK